MDETKRGLFQEPDRFWLEETTTQWGLQERSLLSGQVEGLLDQGRTRKEESRHQSARRAKLRRF